MFIPAIIYVLKCEQIIECTSIFDYHYNPFAKLINSLDLLPSYQDELGELDYPSRLYGQSTSSRGYSI